MTVFLMRRMIASAPAEAPRFQFGIVDIWAAIPLPFFITLCALFFSRHKNLEDSLALHAFLFFPFLVTWAHGVYLLSKAGVRKQNLRVAFLSVYMPFIYACTFLLTIALGLIVMEFSVLLIFCWVLLCVGFNEIVKLCISSTLELDRT